MLVRVIFTTTLVRDIYMVNKCHTHTPLRLTDINTPKTPNNQ